MAIANKALSLLTSLLILGACQSSPSTTISELPVVIADESPRSEVGAHEPEPDISPGVGTMSLLVQDSHGRARSGVEVNIQPLNRTLVSGNDGNILLEAAAGYYSVQVITGCKATLHIFSGASARLGIAEGQTTKGTLKIGWRRRYVPAGPVFSSVTPYWPVGSPVEVRFNVIDRCSRDAPAPGASLAPFDIEKVGSVSTGQLPEKADQSGFARIEVICQAEGTPVIKFVDREQPSDAFELTEVDASSGARIECRN